MARQHVGARAALGARPPWKEPFVAEPMSAASRNDGGSKSARWRPLATSRVTSAKDFTLRQARPAEWIAPGVGERLAR
jgi:hypothetical protein